MRFYPIHKLIVICLASWILTSLTFIIPSNTNFQQESSLEEIEGGFINNDYNSVLYFMLKAPFNHYEEKNRHHTILLARLSDIG